MFGLDDEFKILTNIELIREIRFSKEVSLIYKNTIEELKKSIMNDDFQLLIITDTEEELASFFNGDVIIKTNKKKQSRDVKWIYVEDCGFLSFIENIVKINIKAYKLKNENQYLMKTIEKVELNYKLQLETAKEKEKKELNFLSLINHEFKTPLNVMLGLNNLMKGTELNTKQREYVKKMDKAANLLAMTLDEILSYEIVSLESITNSENINIRQMIEDLFLIFTPLADEKKIDLILEISADIKEDLIGDRRKLEIIMTQLISNAIKFTESGFVKLKIETEFEKDNIQRLDFTVHDSGIGFDVKIKDRIAEPFYQESTMLSRKHGGLGLGLTIVKQALDRLNVNLEIDSKVGEGSIFKFSIDFNVNDNKNIKKKIVFNNVKILLVEDNELNRIITKEILINNGIEVTTANDGFEAVEKVQREEFDLILMDIMMPRMDGYMATEIIRDKGFKVPIIALTASEVDVVYDKMFEVGMDDYIEKRLPIDTYLNKLSKHIDKSKLSYTKQEKVVNVEVHEEEVNKIFNLKKALQRFNGDYKILYKVVNNLIDNYENIGEVIEKILDLNQNDELLRLMHSVKGFAGNIDATEIRELASELEKEILYNKIDEGKLWDFVAKMKLFIEEIKPIKEYIYNQLPKEEEVFDYPESEDTLYDLIEALERRDVRLIRKYNEIIKNSYKRGHIKFAETLDNFILNYKFDEAVKEINIFLKR